MSSMQSDSYINGVEYDNSLGDTTGHIRTFKMECVAYYHCMGFPLSVINVGAEIKPMH